MDSRFALGLEPASQPSVHVNCDTLPLRYASYA